MTDNSRTTIVFGGSSGIGRAIADRCAQDGDDIILIARNEEKLERAVEGVLQSGAQSARFLSTDHDDSSRVHETLKELVSLAPSPQRLVLNGGGPPFGRFTEISLEVWQSSIQSTLLSHVQILHTMVPRLTKGSSVVAVLSDVVRNAAPEKVLPCSLRLALLGLIKCLALEYSGDDIRFNAISPGPTETLRAVNLLRKAATEQGISEEAARERFVSELPMGRMASPQEVAEVAHFLLSDSAGYVSGMNYICDGCLSVVPL